MPSHELPLEAVAELKAIQQEVFSSKEDLAKHLQERSIVIARFKELFKPEHIPELTAEEFKSFLSFKNNKHWSNLERLGPRITKDMPKLRQALSILVAAADPMQIAARLDEALGLAYGMGKGVATALLLVLHDDDYGVWNTVTEEAMSAIGLFPTFQPNQSTGKQYAAINDILRQLKNELDVDLWTLDWIWWRYMVRLEAGEDEEGGEDDSDSDSISSSANQSTEQRFRQERALQDFLYTNWETTILGENWKLKGRDNDDTPGYEFRCDDGVGRIDLLAVHKTEPRWLVIEVKKQKSDEQALGQLLRYMGWVKDKYVSAGSSVEGMLISSHPSTLLKWALRAVPNVTFKQYRVQFDLEDPQWE